MQSKIMSHRFYYSKNRKVTGRNEETNVGMRDEAMQTQETAIL